MRYTTTGSLLPATFLYSNHTWEVLARVDDRNPGAYDANEGDAAICVYRGFHSGFVFNATSKRYVLWNSGVSANCASWTMGTSGTEIVQGQWFHAAVTRSGNVFSKYLNGKLVSSLTQATGATAGVTADLHLGAATVVTDGSASFSSFSKSTVSNMKMYNRALTSDEIHANFNAIRGRFGI